MKLSKAQIRAIEDAKRTIAKAREFDTWEEYVADNNSYCVGKGGVEYVKAHREDFQWVEKYWERERQGDFLSHAGKNTIEALVRLGIFSKPEYSEHRKQGVLDWVHFNEDWEA